MKSTPAICALDLGSWTFKVCAFNGDRFQVLTNQANFRQTPSLVGYTATERLIGQPAIIKIKNNFANTIRAPQRLLGLQKHQHLLEQQLKYQKSKSICEKGLEFLVQGKQGEMRVSTEEVLISLVSKVRSIIQSHQLELSLGYIAVPTYLGHEERYILKRCAQIALEKPVRIIDDWTAVSAQYAYTRIKQLKTLEQMRNVIFLDVGYSKVSLTLVQFTRFESRLLDSQHLPYTGCKNMDRSVSQFYNEHFFKKFNSVILSNLKAYPKLLDAVQRQRTVLSANNQHHLNLEYLMGEQDLVYNMTRQEFQNIIVPVLADIAASLASFQSRNSSIPIHSIELLGGGSRIPCIQSITTKIFGIEPSRTLNQSEAIVMGSTVFGCVQRKILNLAYTFDSLSTRKIGFKWNKNNKELFLPQTKVPYTQSLNFGNQGLVEGTIFTEQGLMQKQIGKVRFKTPNKLEFTLDQNKILSLKGNLGNVQCEIHSKSQKEWDQIRSKEEEMQKLDIRMGTLYQMKNDFESKFYWCKNKYEELRQYADSKEVEEIEKHILIAAKWVEDQHHNHSSGSEKDLQVFEAKLNEIAILKKLCENLQQLRRSVDQLKTKYDRLSEEISSMLELKLSEGGQQRLLQIMNWGQQAYQKMENSGWRGNQLTLQNIQQAIICVQSLKP